MNEKLFIWDFHGTLEHGNDYAVVEISNLALEQLGIPRRMSIEDAEFLAGKRWHEYFQWLLPDADLKTCLELQETCVSIGIKNPEIMKRHIKLTIYAEEVLEQIDRSPHSQIVLSNTQPKSLDVFLESVGIERYFLPHQRIGMDTHSQINQTKKDWLRLYLEERDFHGVVSIGDSPGDAALAACHSKGISYLFSHPHRPHREAACHYKINDLRAILREL